MTEQDHSDIGDTRLEQWTYRFTAYTKLLLSFTAFVIAVVAFVLAIVFGVPFLVGIFLGLL